MKGRINRVLDPVYAPLLFIAYAQTGPGKMKKIHCEHPAGSHFQFSHPSHIRLSQYTASMDAPFPSLNTFLY
jgi:hypothetical protein